MMKRGRHSRLRALLLLHHRKPSCFHKSHDITSCATVSMILFQKALSSSAAPLQCLVILPNLFRHHLATGGQELRFIIINRPVDDIGRDTIRLQILR